ncbi:MAG: putative lipid II flippase FtsW [Vicinamibacterales bacterium]|jgi:cell division protein FtsW|nr:putative lipid II flippase FtsW [Vicinamibacterales bacterium]
MARKLRYDWLLFMASFALVALSVVMVYSASSIVAAQRFDDPYYFVSKQIAFVVVGCLVLAVMMRVDYHVFGQPGVVWALTGTAAAALILVLLVGSEVKGARRWFGFAGVGVQPSEFAKFAAVVFTAALLERRMAQVNDLREVVLPVGAMLAIVTGLILKQPDLGTAVTLAVAVSVMVIAAGVHWRYVAAAAALALPALAGLLLLKSYRWQRVIAFLDPEQDRQGGGWQILQSLAAVGNGGVLGVGLMESVQKRFWLPEAHNDFIYAVIAEELGMVGAALTVVAFAVVAWRGAVISGNAPDRLGAFLALGLTVLIVFQALLNVSVVLGLLPTKGIPLPLVSAGGSSLLVSFLAIGVLLNVSKHASARW